jgi:hypothetical protein
MVAIDLRVPSANPQSKNGPFLRLASSNGGWLFETKYGEPVMEEMPTEKGLWALRVRNDGVGIALREHPADYQHNRVSPEINYPDGYILFVDLKVKGTDGVVFYRVQGTRGWVFSNRGLDIMTQEISVQQAVSMCRVPTNPASTYAFDLDMVRELAYEHELEEIQFNPQSRVIGFLGYTDDGVVRINVYYSTGTVGTALDHPVQGPTQLFRRRCTVGDLYSIMSDPRWHSGRGYKRRCMSEDSVYFKICDTDTGVPPDETHALRMSLQETDAELIELQARRDKLAKQVTEMDTARYDAAVEELKEKRRKEKEMREKEIKLQQAKLREQQRLEERKRGDKFDWCLVGGDKRSTPSTSTNVMCLGGTGDCLLTLDMENDFFYTAGLPTRLHQLLHTRASHHPRPVVVALGGNARFYIEFANGKSEWSANIYGDLDNIFREDTVHWVAFGCDEDSYVVHHNNQWSWGGDIPNRLIQILHTAAASDIRRVSLGPNREWFVSFKSGVTQGGGWSGNLNASMSVRRNRGEHVRDLVFGENHSYMMRYSDYSGPF